MYAQIYSHIHPKNKENIFSSSVIIKTGLRPKKKISRKQKQGRKISMITMQENQKLKIKTKHTKYLSS